MLAGVSFDSLFKLVATTAFILAVLWAATVGGAIRGGQAQGSADARRSA